MHAMGNRRRSDRSAESASRTAVYCAVVSIGFAAIISTAPAQAEDFTFDWAADGSPTFSGTHPVHGDQQVLGQTPFLYERVSDSFGVEYYHMIIGSPGSGFGEELYIKLTAPFTGYGSVGLIGGPSDSGGAFGAPGNGANPLGTSSVTTGNATGNPTNVLLDMVLNDGEFSMEFLKDKFDRKPAISQTINAPDITSTVVIDMRNSTYSDMNIPGVMTNTMSLQGPNLPADRAQFDMATDAQYTNVNAGRYTYSGGTYTYLDGGFNAANVKWDDFFDPTQTNPWAYPTNHP